MIDVPPAEAKQFLSQEQEWALLIFFYNEGPKLLRQLRRLPARGERTFDVILGDDGSTDNCADESRLGEFGINSFVRLDRNRGLSSIMKATLHWVLSSTSYRGLVFVNGN